MSVSNPQIAEITLTTSPPATVRTRTEPAGGSSMSAATILRRPWFPALNMLLAIVAVAISVFALATTPDLPTAVRAPLTPAPAQRTTMDPSSNPLLPGCNLGLGVCDNPIVPD